MIYELDVDGYFIVEWPGYPMIDEEANEIMPPIDFWTDVPIPQPIGKPRFIDGAWVDEAGVDPIEVPAKVTMRQARLALNRAGLISAVGPAIASIPDEMMRTETQIQWEYSQELDRDQPFVINMAGILGLSNEQLDQLFILAATF